MRQKKIKIEGKEISYYETRDNGYPVVLVHGMSSSSVIFIRQLIDSVLSYQFRFIAVDLIGHGNSSFSDNPQNDYSLKGLGKFLYNFTNELNLEKSVFVGHDVGGNVILEAYESLNNPSGLALLGSVPFANPLADETFQDTGQLNLFSKAGIDDSEVHQIAGKFVEEDTKYPDFLPEIIRKADLSAREQLFNSIKNGEYKDQAEIIKTIQEPVAVYYGEHDQIISLDHLYSIEIPRIWRSSVQIIRNVGHIFFYESPADFNVSFEAYLNTVFN